MRAVSVSSAAGWVRLTHRCSSAISVCARRIGPVVKTVGLSVIAMCSAFLVGLLGGSPSAVAGGNCQDKLVGNAYACSIKVSNGPAKTDCYEFTTEGESQHFDFFDS